MPCARGPYRSKVQECDDACRETRDETQGDSDRPWDGTLDEASVTTRKYGEGGSERRKEWRDEDGDGMADHVVTKRLVAVDVEETTIDGRPGTHDSLAERFVCRLRSSKGLP